MKIKTCLFLLICLVSSWGAFADPCEVVNNHDEGDGSGYNSSSLRYIVDDFINGLTNAHCDSLGSEDDADFDQTIIFNSALDIELNNSAGGIVFDVETAAGQLIVGSSSSTLSKIDGTLLGAGESPFQCSSGTADSAVSLRNLLIITKDTNEADFYLNNLCLIATENVYVCQEADYDDSVSPGTTGWCGGDDDDDDDDDGFPDFPHDLWPPILMRFYATVYADADGDAYGDAGVSLQVEKHLRMYDSDGDGIKDKFGWQYTVPAGFVEENTDCDDTTAARFPGNPEICDGLDNDCNFIVDDGLDCTDDDTIYYPDDDGDAYGDPVGPTVTDTTPPDGYVEDHTDCNDANAAIYPGAAEVCDGVDNDCDGQVDEGFDVDGDGYTTCEGDCDDGDIAVHPEGTEICEDGIDQDCNGSDEICAEDDNDDDGYTEDNGDCDDTNPAINPDAAEICDGIDNDCDGQIDEGFDVDGDGYTTCEGDCDDGSIAVHPEGTEICEDGIDQDCNGSDEICAEDDNDDDGYTEDNGDCDDTNPAINPSATEVCDGVDNDCDGQVDEGFDADSDGYTTCEGDCDDGSSAVHPDAAEICDDIDNDCDGTVDENDVCDGTDDDQDGFVSDDDGGTDCNDSDASVYPGATEICGDGIDQDCSGSDVVCEACSDGLDNDGDGAIDCADADCLQDDACVDTDVIVPGGIVCDVSIDINADGLPDALDPAFGDADGDGIPDCCTDGNGDVVLINYDSDGDDVPNCREFALSSDPSISDIGFQGGAENFGCSLSLVFQTTSEKTDRGLWFMILILASFGLFRIRKARMNLLKPQMIGLVVIVLLSLARPAHALNVQTFAPADAVGSGYGLFTSQTLVPGQFVIGSFFNYAQHPLEIGFTNNNARVFGVVDKFITADLIATVGLFKHVNLTANMPINLYHDIAPTLIPNRDRGGPDLGDLRVSSKIQFLDADTTAGNWGFAVVPFVTAPTGDASVYLGDTGITGGGTVIGEKKFGPHRLYVNAGAQFKKEETLGNLVVGNAVTYGAGYQHQFSETHAISGIVEVQGSTAMNNLFGSEITTPVGARAILQKNFLASRNLHTYVGGGMGITSGYGASDFRVYSGLSFTFNAPHHKKVVEAVTPEENFVGLVYFENDRDQFTQDNWATIEDAADFWKNHQSSPVLVVGHADSNWTNDYNMKLSERRALTVLKSLVKLGVPQDIIKVSYYGEEQPVDTNDTDAGRNNNRAAKMQIIVGEI